MTGTDRLDVSAFAACLHQEFRLALGAGQVLRLELVEVKDLGTRDTDAGPLGTYSLVFLSPGELRHAPQGTYRLEHDALGAHDVFLVPIGPRGTDGMCYQAVFN
jgi:hypothetical protein